MNKILFSNKMKKILILKQNPKKSTKEILLYKRTKARIPAFCELELSFGVFDKQLFRGLVGKNSFLNQN